jgi:hypothetical protein
MRLKANVAHMGEMRILVVKHEGKTPHERIKGRLEDNIKINFK